jgi:glycosidase
MPMSLAALPGILQQARTPTTVSVQVGTRTVVVPRPFPSPQDWRDVWIYFLLVDRFNNPAAPPRQLPWDGVHGGFQGGTLQGVQAQLDYLQQLGAGALWLSPVLKNCQYLEGTYHGYGIQDFLAIDPRLASDPDQARANPSLVEDELAALIDQAHARGLYVILDIVLNHTGDVFAYQDLGAIADWRDAPYPVRWRDETGSGRPDWPQPPTDPHPDAAVWPAELHRNQFFRRQGNAFTPGRSAAQQEQGGDFYSLKELVTDARGPDGSLTIRNTLILAYQYLIARFDIDGFRIDTLKFVEEEFARVFGNAMREFALSIGKRNFFTFGEVYDNEDKIARFIGRRAMDRGDLVGVDAALDFPQFYRLPAVAKGFAPPAELVAMYQYRKQVQAGVVSSHGEASRYFVSFLDNHDQHQRLGYSGDSDPGRFADQATLALACLFTLQGIPCVYYGTEHGLTGHGDPLEAVREALWGKPGAFDLDHPTAKVCQQLTAARQAEPALRYGRQYFRPISGDGRHFGISPYAGGVLAFSRILNDREVLIVANTHTGQDWTGEVIVDRDLNPTGVSYQVRFTNKAAPPSAPDPVADKPAGSVEIHEVDGAVTIGPARTLPLTVAAMEALILIR